MTGNRLFAVLFVFSLSGMLCAGQQRILSLEQCLEMSMENNVQVKNAILDVDSAKELKKEALSKYFPEVSATAFAFHSLHPLIEIGMNDVIKGGDMATSIKYYLENFAALNGISTSWSYLGQAYTSGVSAIQPVFAGGRIVNGNSLARLGIDAATLKKGLAEKNSRNDITSKYWGVVALSEKKKVLQKAIELVTNLSADVKCAREAGLSNDNDQLQVKVKSKELESKMAMLRRGERLAKMDLFNAIGMEYGVADIDDIVLADDYSKLSEPQAYYMDPVEVAALSDESKLLELQVKSKEIQKKMTVGEALPEVGIGATYGFGKVINGPRTNGAVFASVKIPLSQWGSTSRRIRRCEIEIEKARNEKAYLDSQLVLKARKEWMNVECAWEQIQVQKEAVALAELNEIQKQDAYKAGMCSMSDLLKAQTELQTADSALADSYMDYCNSITQWLSGTENLK